MEAINKISIHALQVFEWALLSYFFLSCLYIFTFALAGHFYKKRRYKKRTKLNKIGVFIPAYKEDNVIVEVVKVALKQKYPSSFYEVIVIADSMLSSTINELDKLPIRLVEVSFEKSTKSKALNAAMNHLTKSYDYCLILDADNIMEPQLLTKFNDAFNEGYQAIQGHRRARNLNTSFAILDAASEEINNHIYRKGHSALGLSSGLIGSGMAFKYDLFKEVMSTIQAVGGFDKELEFELAKRKIHIEYLQEAVVLDEKIQQGADFSNQRKRWIATQLVYLKKYYKQGLQELFTNNNITFFDKVVQMVLPPRVLLLGFTFLITVIYGVKEWIFDLQSHVSSDFWLLNFGILFFAFALSFPKSLYTFSLLKSVIMLPSAFLRMTLLLFKLKGANRKFIHTTHGVKKN